MESQLAVSYYAHLGAFEMTLRVPCTEPILFILHSIRDTIHTLSDEMSWDRFWAF